MGLWAHLIRRCQSFAPRRLEPHQGFGPFSGPARWSCAILLTLVFAHALAWAQPAGQHRASYDRRLSMPAIRDLQVRPSPAQRDALARLRQNLDGSLTQTFDRATGVTRTLSNPVGYLTPDHSVGVYGDHRELSSRIDDRRHVAE